ncbi:hypothetical protein GCM10025867_38760 [Frondihabitans sucicola]|uniref:Putative Flp pilus-assembly TadG-like N-terminal domain-containing protein n=1 Tax=Frondihabitans sucicola TaxID=1268041 RepID=A0ABN6Y6M3_9MICO|nr:Rv3654c family TadE-like protein [Frondihabitans sucicola]BDZ51635.1 hypothetical protein GCM10025867_38760 [Frondihabitans sucicola]
MTAPLRARKACSRRARDDSGTITVLAAAIVGAVTATTLAIATAAGVLVERHRLGAGADAAALAAADVASGVVPGSPCEVATTVAAANRARIVTCETEGSSATVAVSSRVGPFVITVAATAGQPRSPPSPRTASSKK